MLWNETNVMETGTRAVSMALFSTEMINVMSDARWMLLAITVCVLADFRYGWGESSKRYSKAKAEGDRIEMAQYRWRTSRALRRTVNKLIDYFIWVSLGMIFGIAILRPLGVDYVIGGIGTTCIAIACEAKSFMGHFFYLHGISIEEKSVKGFLRAFIVAFAKRKDSDIGEALEEGFNENNRKETSE